LCVGLKIKHIYSYYLIIQRAEKNTSLFNWLTQCVCPLRLACPSMKEEAPELSHPALGAGGCVVRPGAGWAQVTLTQTDGKSGWKCSFCQKEFAGMNRTRVRSYEQVPSLSAFI